MQGHLHIVSFDVPLPANYGGVVDVYYKLLWLHKAGVRIHLHCYSYGRPPAPELKLVCEKVYYYKRKTGLLSNLSVLPYTVNSRRSADLEKNLLADNQPILFETLHTCYLLTDKRFEQRKKIYRHSNIEHAYYTELARSERGLIKKLYLQLESRRLEKFEPVLSAADLILAVNRQDTGYFKRNFEGVRSLYLPSFHANALVTSKPGQGNYILFHGNLSVSENYDAVLWLIANVFSKQTQRVVVAGLNPPGFLARAIAKYKHIDLVAGPSETKMEDLVHNAQVHVLYTAQPTGLKLKLLNVLFKGRFVICNGHMLAGTGLHNGAGLVTVETAVEFIHEINAALAREFTPGMLAERTTLVRDFDNSHNAATLIEATFGVHS